MIDVATVLAIVRCLARTLCVLTFAAAVPATADSSSPLLAAYYDRQMAIVNDTVYAWKGNARPQQIPFKGIQVGVGRNTYFLLTRDGVLLGFRDNFQRPLTLTTNVARFAAGQHGVLAIKTDATLWWIKGVSRDQRKIADGVAAAAVGDGANYYIANSGALFVMGKAHRGQYGDGRLKTTDHFVQTASDVAQITAHTGHAILRRRNGDVMGTGGNIYGPVGKHGLGDKATQWSKILSGARAIATGSSHSLAILQDGRLMAWGREYGPDPVTIAAGVVAVAAGSSTTIALNRDGSLWQWNQGETTPRPLISKRK